MSVSSKNPNRDLSRGERSAAELTCDMFGDAKRAPEDRCIALTCDVLSAIVLSVLVLSVLSMAGFFSAWKKRWALKYL